MFQALKGAPAGHGARHFLDQPLVKKKARLRQLPRQYNSQYNPHTGEKSVIIEFCASWGEGLIFDY
jgi:hypothetical protein